ncbi:MAG: hypothetical protein WCT00_01865 [Bacilli bacterium]|jgi:tetratricopeptide (TPR) repeat protein|nr:hypothetical protein [Acholeplasmataceae bacterium]
MGRYVKGFSFMENENYQQAYQEFSRIISQNKRDYSAYFYRGMIDFYFLKQNLMQTKADFEMVLSKKPKFAKQLYGPLAIISDMTNNHDDTIDYGTRALAFEEIYDQPELALGVNFAISRAYFNRSLTRTDYYIALEHLNKCMELSNDDLVELYLCKCDIYMALDEYQELLNTLDKMMTIFSIQPIFYLVRARALTNMARSELDEDKRIQLLEQALELFQIYFQYEESDPVAYFYQADVYRLLNRFDEAVKVYEAVKDKITEDEENQFQDETIVSIMKTLEMSDKPLEAISYGENYISTQQSWRVEYGIAELILNFQEEAYEKAINLLRHAFSISRKLPVALFLVETYQRYYQYEQCLKWLYEVITDDPNDGRWYYYAADIASKLRFSYDEVEDFYLKAHRFGYLDLIGLCDMVIPLLKNPFSWTPRLKALSKKLDRMFEKNPILPQIEPYIAHKQSVRSLLGLHGMRINQKRSFKYAKYCVDIYPEDCCFNTNLGRVYEFIGDEEKAFEIYFNTYGNILNDNHSTCQCAAGYLAHAYYQGIGTKQDTEAAVKIIQNAYQVEKEVSDSSVLYLYAYFALKGYPGFDLYQAINNLEHPSSFQRYEISRYQLLIALYEKVGRSTQNLKRQLHRAYYFDSILARKYYQKHRNDPIYYPFFNHY